MGSLEKLKKKLANNPKSVRFKELERVLFDLGYVLVRSRGSHHVYRPEGSGASILLVKPHGGRIFCAMVDVKKVIELIETKEGKV